MARLFPDHQNDESCTQSSLCGKCKAELYLRSFLTSAQVAKFVRIYEDIAEEPDLSKITDDSHVSELKGFFAPTSQRNFLVAMGKGKIQTVGDLKVAYRKFRARGDGESQLYLLFGVHSTMSRLNKKKISEFLGD